MKQIICSLLLAAITSQLLACVEVRDDEKPQTPPVEESIPPKPAPESQSSAAPAVQRKELVIDQEMHLYRGQILTMDQIDKSLSKNEDYDWTPSQVSLSYDKVTFTNQGVLYIYDNDLHLKIAELDSSHGTIATYQEGQQAQPEKNGRSGGNLTLEVAKATGTMSVYMRGEKGGQGVRGQDVIWNPHGIPVCGQENGGTGEKGKKGGDSGFLKVQFTQMDLFGFDPHLLPGTGGPGGQGGAGYERFGPDRDKKCDKLESTLGVQNPHPGAEGPQGDSGAALESFVIRGSDRKEIR